MDDDTVLNNWTEVDDHLRQLYPQLYKYRMSMQLASLWRKRLGQYTVATALRAIDDFAADKKFFPSLSEIIARCRSRTSCRTTDALLRRQQEEHEREILGLHWQAVDQVLEDYDLEKEKQALLKMEPRFKWAEDVDATSRWWKGPIYVHLKQKGRPPSQS